MKRTKLSVILAFFASLALAAFLSAQTAPAAQSDQASQPAAQSQSDSSQQAQPAQPSTSDQSNPAQSPDTTSQDQAASPSAGADKDMPKTASDLPLVALLGFTSLGAGLLARRYSKRTNES